jgi:transposase-like protein
MEELERIDLPKLIEEYGSEAKCRAFMEALRWPNGVECPRCKGTKVSRIASRNQFDCDSCRYQFSATAGTVFHDSHLPLWKWFLAVYMLCESKKGVSANQLKRMLGVSYKTAWYLCHRIRQAMTAGIRGEGQLHGTVEMDDTRIGGEAQRWRPIPKKAYVVGMVERDGGLRFKVVSDLTSKSLAAAARKHVSKDIDLIITDEWAAYVNALGYTYNKRFRRIKHKKTYVQGNIHTNSIENAFSLLKRGITGSWHHVSAKHLQRYLDEMSFRFSERKNPRLFSDTLSELLSVDPLTFKRLTAKKVA